MAGFVSEERLVYGSWQATERMLARLLEHSGFVDVQVVGGCGDHGADIVGIFNEKKWIIQSKYRKHGAVDSSALREVVNASAVYKADVAVAATNQTFSQDANLYRQNVLQNGVDLRLWNGYYLLNYFQKLKDISSNFKELRPYQVSAVDAVENHRSEGNRTAIVIMATGLGKTLVADQLIVNELERNPNQEILCVAHMTDLVRQLDQASWSQLKKQYSTHLWTDGETPTYCGGVVFATWQSIVSAQEKDPMKGRFGLVLVDEAHHALANVFRHMIELLSPSFLVGLTATPWRGDDKNLYDLFGQPTFKMDIVDGMQQGYLADVDYRMLTDGIDWEEISRMSRQGLTIKDLNSKLILPDRDIAIVEKFVEHFLSIENPKAMVFCRSIDHANRLQSLLAINGVSSCVVHSGLPREIRFTNLSSFRTGQINCVLSVEMLNEGIDVPDVNLVAFMRVTHSRRIFIQQLGRGLRLRKGKTKVLVLDFVADIRRIAAGLTLNHEATERACNPEVIKYQDGRIIQFDNDISASFFNEYLADVADIENMGDGATLRFPE
jgi:superfamily II DNA or RNA helicase